MVRFRVPWWAILAAATVSGTASASGSGGAAARGHEAEASGVQDHGPSGGRRPAEHDDHEAPGHDHRFELGGAAGLVYLLGERELAFGLHVHALAAIPPTSWAVGIGYERLFDDHAHNTVGPVVQYRITPRWSVNASPGITFSDREPGHLAPAGHLETAYEFRLGPAHFGPSAEAAFDPEDVHFTLGVHLGMGF
jgi:hypothetical protein